MNAFIVNRWIDVILYTDTALPTLYTPTILYLPEIFIVLFTGYKFNPCKDADVSFINPIRQIKNDPHFLGVCQSDVIAYVQYVRTGYDLITPGKYPR